MQQNNQSYITAASILLGFIILSAAIYFSSVHTPSVQVAGVQEPAVDIGEPRREGAQRNIYGNPEAEITIVEFSDYECPYCARLHPTLKQIVDGSDGDINWEYRHLPIASHRNAMPAAIAAECVAQLAGNDAFWSYTDAILANQRGVTAEFLRGQAADLGVDGAAYTVCLADEEVLARVQDDAQTASKLGGAGTPYSVVRFADGTSRPVRGALPYEQWTQVLAN
jgi:protein-disulfide isomerase